MKRGNSHCYHLLKTLSNSLRIRILENLKIRDMSVSELVNSVGEEQSKVSHALKALLCCNIVYVRRDGKKRIYSMNKDTIFKVFEIMDRHVDKYCKDCRRKAD